LLDGTSLRPIGFHESFYIFEEDGVVDGGVAHGFKALLVELSYIETKIVLPAHLIGSFTGHVIVSLAFHLWGRTFSFSRLAAASSYRRAIFTE